MARAALALLFLLAAPLLAVPAAATPPATAFCVIVIEGIDDFRAVRVAVDLTTNLTQRQGLFAQLDTDHDGVVAPPEQDAFRRGTVEFWPNATRLGLKGLTLGAFDAAGSWEAQALHAVTWRKVGHTFHHQNYTQPAYVTQPVDLETQEVREVRFDQVRAPQAVRLLGGVNLTAPRTTVTSTASPTYTTVVEYVVVRAPPGWLVERIEGHTYTGAFGQDPHAAEVDVPAFDTKSPYTITFSRIQPGTESAAPTPTVTVTQERTVTATRDAPAAAAGFAALLLGAAAFTARRRLP